MRRSVDQPAVAVALNGGTDSALQSTHFAVFTDQLEGIVWCFQNFTVEQTTLLHHSYTLCSSTSVGRKSDTSVCITHLCNTESLSLYVCNTHTLSLATGSRTASAYSDLVLLLFML